MHPKSGKKYAADAAGPADGHDLSHIWLPYAQMKTAAPPLPVVATRGSRIILADGTGADRRRRVVVDRLPRL